MSYTRGPWSITESGILTNDGAQAVMGQEDEGDTKRVALVDCQTRHKRGEGWKTDCSERSANARLISAAPELLEALQLADALLRGANMDRGAVERKVLAALAKAGAA